MTLLVKEKMKKTSNTVLVGVIVVNDMLFLISSMTCVTEFLTMISLVAVHLHVSLYIS